MSKWRTLVGLIAALGATALSVPELARADRPFQQRYAATAQGDITIIGNTLLSCSDNLPNCADVRNGVAEPPSQNNNNAHFMTWVDADGDVDTVNSSSATLTLPPEARVLFAGVYWGGRSQAGVGGSAAPAPAARERILVKPPGATDYTVLNATAPVDASGQFYQSFADVTAAVDRAGSGVYTVADAALGTGRHDQQLGGWALVVAYGDPSAPSRSLVVFDGFLRILRTAAVTIPLSGFRTPLAGDVRAELGLLALEGENAASGDRASFNGSPLTNAANPVNNIFNGSVSRAGVIVSDRDPDYINTLGWDVDQYSTLNVLGNDQSSTSVDLSTTLDSYASGVATMAIDLYAPRVEAVKTVDLAAADLGDELTYTVRLTNSGHDAADALTFTDSIPAGTTFVPGSLQASAIADGAACPPLPGPELPDPVGSQIVVGLGAGGRLGVGETQCARFRVRVNETGLRSGTVIANRARADFTAATTGIADAGVQTAPARTAVRVPDLVVGKAHAPGFVPGGTSTFTIEVRNVGNGATHAPVTVRDTLHHDLTLTGAIAAPGWTCTTAGTPVEIICSRIDTLAPVTSFPPIRLPVRIAGNATPGNLSNTATVEYAADGDPANNTTTDAGAVSQPLVDLVVTKTAPDRRIDDVPMPYTITVTNRGISPAPNVVVADTLPTDFELLSIDPSQGSCDPTAATCQLGTLASGATATIELLAAPPFLGFPGDTDLTNAATATSGGRELNPADNSAAVTRRSVPVVDVYIEPEASSPVLAGGEVTLTFRVANRGPQAAEVLGTGDVVFDAPGLDLINGRLEVTRGPGECVADGLHNTWCGFPSIEPGGERIVTVTATVPATAGGHVFQVNAGAHASQYESFLTTLDNLAQFTVPIQGVNVAVEKIRVGSHDPVPPGSEATFRLTASNAGGMTSPFFEPEFLNLAATGVTVRDELPPGMTLTGAPDGCTATGRLVSCDAGTLAVGEQRSFDLRVRAEPEAAQQRLTNVATVSAAEADWHPEDDRAVSALNVGPLAPGDTSLGMTSPARAADLSVHIQAPRRPVREGDSPAWRITARNAGPATATAVALTLKPRGRRATGARLSQAGCRAAVPDGCALGSLAPGERRTIEIRLRRRLPGRLRLHASIRGAETDPRPADNSDLAAIRVRMGRARVALSKVALRDTVRAAAVASFMITVRTTGRRAARGLTVCDRAPPGLRLLRARDARRHANAVCWRIARLEPGRTRRLRVSARAAGSPDGVRRLVNRATLRGSNFRVRRAAASLWVSARQLAPCAANVAGRTARAGC